MKAFLLIPALILFLSNIPFVHTMDMNGMMNGTGAACGREDAKVKPAVKKDGCCKKKMERSGGCFMSKGPVAAAKGSCKSEQGSAHSKTKKSCNSDAGKCGKQDATCVCICLFQYAAPGQVTVKFQFGFAVERNDLSGYIPRHWKDPQLMAPWQPPDVA